MIAVNKLIACLSAILLFQSVSAKEENSCESAGFGEASVTLVFKASSLEGEIFYGTFEVTNRGLTSSLVIPGYRDSKGFAVVRPESEVEFRDLTGQWVPLLPLPGTYLPRPHQLVIPVGKVARIKALLMPKKVANLSSSDFRLVLRLPGPNICVVSESFRATPFRAEVEGFVSYPVGSPK